MGIYLTANKPTETTNLRIAAHQLISGFKHSDACNNAAKYIRTLDIVQLNSSPEYVYHLLSSLFCLVQAPISLVSFFVKSVVRDKLLALH